MLRRALIWMLLFALPLQSLAAVAKMHCAQSPTTSAAIVASTQAPCHQHPTSADQTQDDGACHHHDQQGSKDAGKCSACHACCVGMISPISPPSSVIFATTGQVLVPHSLAVLPSVFLEGPQRPPRPSSLS